MTPSTRYVVLSAVPTSTLDTGGASIPLAPPDLYRIGTGGDTIEDAQRLYLDAIAEAGTRNVLLAEVVPVILHDGRGAQGVFIRLAEKLGWCQRVMIENGISVKDLERKSRLSESTISKMFSGESVSRRNVESIEKVLHAMIPAEDED